MHASPKELMLEIHTSEGLLEQVINDVTTVVCIGGRQYFGAKSGVGHTLLFVTRAA